MQKILYDALLILQDGNVQVIKQSSVHPVGFYCGRRIAGDENIDWNWSSQRIHNFVRAIVPPAPGARTFLNDSELVILKTEIIENAPTYTSVTGEVVGIQNNGVIVKTGDTTLRITMICDLNENDQLVNERIPLLKIGSRLGFDNPWIELKHLKQKINQLEMLLDYKK